MPSASRVHAAMLAKAHGLRREDGREVVDAEKTEIFERPERGRGLARAR